MKRYLRWIIAFLIIFVGSFAFASSAGYANPGGFDVPEVHEDFGEFDHAPGSQQEQPINETEVQVEEKGTWDKLTESVKEGWEWTKEKASAVWNWTKETASAFWDEIKSIISKIADVVVDALSAVWNWILEHKKIAVVALIIIGIIVAVIGFVVEAAIAVTVGVGILGGVIISGFFSWISGNELFGDEMLLDMLFGGIAGAISALFGLAAGTGAFASSVGRWLGIRIPWLGRAFPKMFGGGVTAGVDQSLWDLFKTGKINWKNTAIAAIIGFTVVLGGEYLGKHSDDMIKWINNREIPSFSQFLVKSGDSAAMTAPTIRIGDTPFGQWLQKFAAEGGKSSATSGIAAQKDS
ncbi:MAG: hypothetical protein WB502_07915, partial [Thermoactinomyces sp.]